MRFYIMRDVHLKLIFRVALLYSEI